MNKNVDNKSVISKNRHSCYILKYHLVVVTKYRHPVICSALEQHPYELVKAALRMTGDVELYP